MNIIEAIGLGLTNSIWFGLFGYAALKILNALIGEDKPEVRYYLFSSIMFIVLFLTIYTISHLAVNNNYISANGQEYLRINYSSNQSTSNIPVFLQLQFFRQLLISLNEIIIVNISPILIAWITGVLLFSIRYFLAIKNLSNIKSCASTISDSGLDVIINKIRSAVGISLKIKVAESRLVAVPSVIGIFKPIVLLPAGIISSMPAEQIELILAHEFAHIKRLDPLFRFLQSVIEILLFFNPFIWLISKAIDSEREKCCDDSALKVCNNRLALAKALHFIAEYNLQSGIALGFSGKSSGVIPRIKRILKPEINSTGSTTGSASSFAVTIILTLILVTAFPRTSFDNYKNSNNNSVNQANAYRMIKNGDEIINTLENKFGQPESTTDTDPKSMQELKKEIRTNKNESIENAGIVSESLAEKINELLGDESEFENIMDDLEVNIPGIEQFYSPEFSEKLELSKSIVFDHDVNIDDFKELKNQIAEIQKSLEKLKAN